MGFGQKPYSFGCGLNSAQAKRVYVVFLVKLLAVALYISWMVQEIFGNCGDVLIYLYIGAVVCWFIVFALGCNIAWCISWSSRIFACACDSILKIACIDC